MNQYLSLKKNFLKRSKQILAVGVLSLGAISGFGQTGPGVVASDNFDNPKNLTSFVNLFDGAFGNPGDGFQVYQRDVSATIPFAVLDDSGGSFPSDNIGIIGSDKGDAFFGAVDLKNNDNPTGDAMATWVFDISSNLGPDLTVSIDMGAMGDFESSDFYL